MKEICDFLIGNVGMLATVIAGVWQLFRYILFVKVELSCGSFKVRMIFRNDVYVIIRIVHKEFFPTYKKVPPEVIKEIYEKCGPVSWTCSGDEKTNKKIGIKVYITGIKTYLKRYLSFLFKTKE